MKLVRTRAELSRELNQVRSGGRRLALVPTMGSLHQGHLSLVDRAAALADVVVASIFVNPLQFGPEEDYGRYPRDLERDVALCRERGVHVVFAPERAEMYPGGEPRVTVDPGPMALRLCGAFRPGHFRGVLTVVAKLLGIVRPDVAVFGQKDFQQGALIRRMVGDLDLAVQIEMAPIVRDSDGLALSSRNVYLSADQRSQAAGLFQALREGQEAFRAGERSAGRILDCVDDTLARYPGVVPQYRELVDPGTLDPVETARVGSVLAVAAHVGMTRLIDNVIL